MLSCRNVFAVVRQRTNRLVPRVSSTEPLVDSDVVSTATHACSSALVGCRTSPLAARQTRGFVALPRDTSTNGKTMPYPWPQASSQGPRLALSVGKVPQAGQPTREGWTLPWERQRSQQRAVPGRADSTGAMVIRETYPNVGDGFLGFSRGSGHDDHHQQVATRWAGRIDGHYPSRKRIGAVVAPTHPRSVMLWQ